PRMSRPASASGRVRAWMAKGACRPRRLRAVTSASGSPSSAKVMSAAGAGASSAAVSARSRADGCGRRAPEEEDDRPDGRPEEAGRRRGPPRDDEEEEEEKDAERARRTYSGKEKLHQRLKAATCLETVGN